jgi:hypothetical protein
MRRVEGQKGECRRQMKAEGVAHRSAAKVGRSETIRSLKK